jgi:hypothetical protein
MLTARVHLEFNVGHSISFRPVDPYRTVGTFIRRYSIVHGYPFLKEDAGNRMLVVPNFVTVPLQFSNK